jgi:predicted O-methyltransferase YrrM
MKKIFIKEKLKELDIEIEDILLGDFDQIGEYTAKKNRSPDKEQYKKVGCFFRPNYERGILQYYLLKKFEFKKVLEIGFGRGYSTFCMAKAMCDLNIPGEVTTVDPNFDEKFLNQLYQIFPKQWFEKINFVNSTAEEYYKNNSDQRFDLIYIDGDHRYEAVKKDWEYAKDRFDKYVLFDDYHLPTKTNKDIECARLVDEIKGYEKELIFMDRRIFFDDRRIADEEIDYGQVLVGKK